MLSKVGIANQALKSVGVSKFITSLTEKSVEAEVCNISMPLAIRSVLASTWWPFATVRVNLTQVPNYTPPAPWQFAYLYPTDVVEVRYIDTGQRVTRPDLRPAFGEIHAEGKRILLCDIEDAAVYCTGYLDVTERWPVDVCTALAWRLAVEIAIPLTKSQQMEAYSNERYMRALAHARAQVGNAINVGPDPFGEFLSGWSDDAS